MSYEKKAGLPFRIVSAARKEEKTENLQRNLDSSQVYDTEKVKHIAEIIYNLGSGIGYVKSVYNELSEIHGHDISPDGKLGGDGYVVTLRKLRETISDVVNDLSSVMDSFSDELNNSKWGLSPEERAEIRKRRDDLIQKSMDIAEDNKNRADSDMGGYSNDDSDQTRELKEPAELGFAEVDPVSISDEELNKYRKLASVSVQDRGLGHEVFSKLVKHNLLSQMKDI